MDKFLDNSKKTDAHSTSNSSCETTASAYPNPSFPEQNQLNQPPILIHTQINSSELPDFSFENVTHHQASLRDTEDDVYSLYSLNSSSDTSEFSLFDFEEEEQLRPLLAEWAVKCNPYLPRELLNELLVLLHKYHPSLPLDGRTLKSTPRKVQNVCKWEDGSYVNFGVKPSIDSFLKKYEEYNAGEIILDFATDGVPLSRSSGSQIWPILGNVPGYPDVFTFGVFHGYSKPKDPNLFFRNFVSDIEKLNTDGILCKQNTIPLNLRCFIADTPAKAMMLYILGHAGYDSCTKCTIHAVRVGHNMAFPFISEGLRNGQSFRNREHTDYHHTMDQIELERINFDCVKQVPIDYMHAALLGTMRHILKLCIKIRRKPFSFSVSNIARISLALSSIKLPAEFQRQPRSLKNLENFKATEFRNILFYLSIVVFKDVMSVTQYNHFLHLFCAFRILADGEFCQQEKYNNLAEVYLKFFVSNFGDLYLESQSSFNNHALTHLPKDVMNFGKVDNFSAFRFENFMQQLKKMVKKSNMVVEQIHNRLFEYNAHGNGKKTVFSYPFLKKPVSGSYFEKVHLKDFMLSVHYPDNYCLFDKKILKIVKIKENSGIISLFGQIVVNTEPFFQINYLDSAFFGIVCSPNYEKLEPVTKKVQLDAVKTKIVKIEATVLQKQIVYVPYLH
jgi:hypothetical protein